MKMTREQEGALILQFMNQDPVSEGDESLIAALASTLPKPKPAEPKPEPRPAAASTEPSKAARLVAMAKELKSLDPDLTIHDALDLARELETEK